MNSMVEGEFGKDLGQAKRYIRQLKFVREVDAVGRQWKDDLRQGHSGVGEFVKDNYKEFIHFKGKIESISQDPVVMGCIAIEASAVRASIISIFNQVLDILRPELGKITMRAV